MKKIILIITLLVGLPLSAQFQFENGYIIKNNGEKLECLIKNKEWISSPNIIDYKVSEESEVVIGTFNDLTVFKIYNTNHYYKKFTFSLDTNTKSNSQNISTITSLLRVLVEGEASLYEYKGDVFLYANKDSNIKQLVYKQNDEDKINEVHSFQKELFVNLKTYDKTININKLKYNRKDLVKYFTHYNEFQKSEFEIFAKKRTETKFNFNIFGGFGVNSGEINYNQSFSGSTPSSGGGTIDFTKTSTAHFEKLKNYTIGFEVELLLPFNKYKWSVFMSPSYFSQESSKNQSSEGKSDYFWTDKNLTINKINYIEIPIGLKHYFHINSNSKLNLGLSYNFDFFLKKNGFFEINYSNGNYVSINDSDDIVKQKSSISILSGYTYKNKYSISINYNLLKKFKQGNHTIDFDNSILLLLKYTIF